MSIFNDFLFPEKLTYRYLLISYIEQFCYCRCRAGDDQAAPPAKPTDNAAYRPHDCRRQQSFRHSFQPECYQIAQIKGLFCCLLNSTYEKITNNKIML